MNFNRHSELEGLHAFLGASKYHWINYDNDKLITTYRKNLAAQKGTELHEFAATAIRLGIKLPKTNKTLNMYVNDAIGFKMKIEQVLYYSPFCFGTADAISFRNNILRIHDLKTGENPAHIEQLLIYVALFFLEYKDSLEYKDKVKLSDIQIVLRIYQNDEVIEETPTLEDILPIMDKIVTFDKIITDMRLEEI